MARLLHLIASPRPTSYSSRLAEAFLAAYRRAHPDDAVVAYNVFTEPVPPFLAPEAYAKYTAMAGRAPRNHEEAAWAPVLATINHFKSFDKYVISSAMWNFGVAYPLKHYIDVLVQPGLTYAYTPGNGYSGLVTGRPMMLLLARGGVYREGNPLETFDFQDSYLRAIFGFIGFRDIRTILLQGTLENAPDKIEADLQAAMTEAAQAAATF